MSGERKIWLGSFWSRPAGKPPIISIARWDPPWFSGGSVPELAPVFRNGRTFVSGNRRHWIDSYKQALAEHGRISAVRRKLDALLSENESILLACWCKKGRFRKDGSYSGSFCHRLFSGRLLSRLGYPVEVIDLECPRCGEPVSHDGRLVGEEFICRGCVGQVDSSVV